MKRLDISLGLLCACVLTHSLSLFALTEKALDTTGAKSENLPRILEIPFEESPYPLILERMPFGAPPDPNAQTATATALSDAKVIEEQKKLADAFSWTAINITPEGKTAIGFTDLSAKPPETYYITVGESANKWILVSADYASETATIEKDGIQISLKFGNKSPITPTAAGVVPSPGLSKLSHLRTTPSLQTNIPSANPGNNAMIASYRERLNERMKAQENLRQESDRKQKEELSKIVTDALRKQQEEAAAAAAVQEQGTLVVPEGQPIEVNVQ